MFLCVFSLIAGLFRREWQHYRMWIIPGPVNGLFSLSMQAWEADSQTKGHWREKEQRETRTVTITWHKTFLFETTVVIVEYFFLRSCQALMMTIMYEVQWNDRTSAAWERISFDRHYSLAAFENTTLASSVRNNIISMSELKSATPVSATLNSTGLIQVGSEIQWFTLWTTQFFKNKKLKRNNIKMCCHYCNTSDF